MREECVANRRRQFSPGPRAICTFCPAVPTTYFMSEISLGDAHQADRRQAGVARERVNRVRFGIVGAAGPVGAAARRAQRERRQRPVELAFDRRREHRTNLIFRYDGQAPDRAARA